MSKTNNTERNKRLISERIEREQYKKAMRDTTPRGTARAKKRRAKFLNLEITA